ncbi:BRCT domain-containing protein [Vibrio jasicida]|uniref:BRCT domain-containing protein n=1 Tax=Vibrio jasicida TaxID=766224 RepID=UPI0005EFD48B|nr:BRCT domain-containing protein [Vibrio jasicida]
MDVFELLGITQGDSIIVDNPWTGTGEREVIPLALSRNGISIRSIDCRYGDIRYVGADWLIRLSDDKIVELKDFPFIAQKLQEFEHKKEFGKKTIDTNISIEDIEREYASISEILDTIPLGGVKVAITGTLPLPRKEAKALLESKGAVVVGSVNKQTTYLFMGNTGRHEITEKMKKAHSFGVKIITI